MSDDAITGLPTLVSNIPYNVNAPFGLVTRRDKAYVTIAHANEISLMRHFLFSSNSPSKSVSRYVVFGDKIVQDAAVAASLNGNPTDIASRDGYVAWSGDRCLIGGNCAGS